MTKFPIEYRITLNETNVVKGIAICAMFWHHLFFEHPEYGNITFRLSLTCKMCVALFVFLSGYGIEAQYQTKIVDKLEKKRTKGQALLDWVLFLLRRFFKFYLNYWIVFFVAVPLGVFVFGRPLVEAYGTSKPIWISFFYDILGVQLFKSYNITWWINRLFIVLWLLFPLLHWSMKSKAVSLWMLILLFYNPESYLDRLNCIAPGFAYCLALFTLGIFFSVNKSFINNLLNKTNKYALLTSAIIATLTFMYMRNHYVASCFLGVKGDPFIVLSISLSVVCLCRLTNNKMTALSFIGKHSMNMYLLHTFVFNYFFHNFIYNFKHPVLIFLALFLTSLVLSIIFEYIKKTFGFYKLEGKVLRYLNA